MDQALVKKIKKIKAKKSARLTELSWQMQHFLENKKEWLISSVQNKNNILQD